MYLIHIQLDGNFSKRGSPLASIIQILYKRGQCCMSQSTKNILHLLSRDGYDTKFSICFVIWTKWILSDMKLTNYVMADVLLDFLTNLCNFQSLTLLVAGD